VRRGQGAASARYRQAARLAQPAGVLAEGVVIARLVSHGQESWRRDVIGASSDGHYLKLTCASHPHETYHWLESGHLSVLLCEMGADVTAALRDEHPEKDYSMHGDTDKVTSMRESNESIYLRAVRNWFRKSEGDR
jgi:hypothetical protein